MSLRTGATLALKAGRYAQRTVVHHSGVTIRPADTGPDAEEVCFWRSGLEIAGASDVTIEGITFRQSPQSSIVVHGPATNVRIVNCKFLACGLDGGAVTVWLGEGTQRCVIQGNLFDMQSARGKRHLTPGSHTYDIAVMTAERDCVEHLVADNHIVQYSYGIQLGVNGTCLAEGRHTVRGNRIDHPWSDGIHVKQARCVVEDNHIYAANNNSMSARAGFGTIFRNNVCIDGYLGVSIRGRDHEVTGNRFERLRRCAVLLNIAKTNGDGYEAENTLVAGNEMIDCGGADFRPIFAEPCAGIALSTDAPQRLGANTITGAGAPLVRFADPGQPWSLTGRAPT